MTALFIGRFQPFHNGHASVLEQMQRDGITHAIIGVGSSQYSRTDDNPFTYEQRRAMIHSALEGRTGIPSFEVIAIPDIHNPPKWVAHVNSLVPEYDVVYTGNPVVQDLFKSDGANIRSVHKTVQVDGSTIRRMIANGDDQWKAYVHPTICTVIEQR